MKKAVFPAGAAKPLAPYSPAIDAGDLIFCSGQIAIDPATGKMVAGGAAAEGEQVFKNIAALLAAAGLGLDSVVKTTCYLVDLGDFESLSALYEAHFSEPRPARSTIGVAALPLGARVEIEVIAAR